MGKLRDSGGDAYMAHLIGCVSSVSYAEEYAKIIKGYSIRRALIKALQGAQADILRNADENPLDQLQGVLTALQQIELPATSPTFQTAFLQYVEEKENLWNNPDKQDGYSWGHPALDKAWGLIKPTHLVLVLGVANSGKSLFVASELDKLLCANVRTGLISLEMPTSEVLDRLTEMRTGVNFETIRATQDKRAYKALRDYWSELYTQPLELSDRPVKIDDIPALVYQWERASKERIKVLIVDYTTLIMPSDSMARASGHEKLAHISVRLKQIAMELNIAVIAVGQLNRDAYGDAPPELDHIAGSLGFARDANTIIGIHRPNSENPNLLDIHHMKARSKAKSAPVHMMQDGLRLNILYNQTLPERGF